ncbi:hypothetical protein Golob_023323, partial [Gossypium lobatum]|nr:hypothetical protein [Gossypium lobatum]
MRSSNNLERYSGLPNMVQGKEFLFKVMRSFLVLLVTEFTSKKWKADLINSTFLEEVATRILQIPLGQEVHNDMLKVGGECVFSQMRGSSGRPRPYFLRLSNNSGGERVVRYIKELEGIEERKITRLEGNEEWNPSTNLLIKINFDASFNQTQARPSLGLLLETH